MTHNDNNNRPFEEARRAAERKAALRKQAEEQIRDMEPAPLSAQPPEEYQRVLHELRVHQIEFEMQNEELRTAQAEITAGQARYFDLYDLAPVGYCTLSEHNMILEANLTAATLLGKARSALVKQPLSGFILKDDQDIYYLHRKKLLETSEAQEWELRLVKPDGAVFWAHLTATTAQAEDGAPVFLVAIGDITGRKQAEEQKAAAFSALQQEKDELKRWQSLTVGRELAMIELKKEVNALLRQAGQPEKYEIVQGRTE